MTLLYDLHFNKVGTPAYIAVGVEMKIWLSLTSFKLDVDIISSTLTPENDDNKPYLK